MPPPSPHIIIAWRVPAPPYRSSAPEYRSSDETRHMTRYDDIPRRWGASGRPYPPGGTPPQAPCQAPTRSSSDFEPPSGKYWAVLPLLRAVGCVLRVEVYSLFSKKLFPGTCYKVYCSFLSNIFLSKYCIVRRSTCATVRPVVQSRLPPRSPKRPPVIDAPSSSERYSVALASRNLHVSTKRYTTADFVLAAGMASAASPAHTLGCSLIRLQAEIDCVRSAGEWNNVRSFASANTQVAALLLRGIKKLRVAVMNESVTPLSRAVLRTFLDVICPNCEGRGFTGVVYNGEMKTPCRSCRATGTKWHSIGKDEPQRNLAAWARDEMMVSMDRAMGHVRWLLGARS